MVKLCVIKDSKKDIVVDAAIDTIDNRKILLNIYDFKNNCEEGYERFYLDEIELPFIKKYLSYIRLYKGYDIDWGFGSGGSSFTDVIYFSDIYPTATNAKEDEIWKIFEKKALDSPDRFNFYHERICSKDIFDEDFCHGDVMEGKFNMEIKKIRIRKELN